MDATRPPVDEQTALWNGVAGRAWVEAQELLDGMFRPLEDLLVDEVRSLSPARVLDVGCGTGGTTLAVARRLEAGGHCTGVDLSEPMIASARARAAREAAPASFVCADAQRHAFEAATFDLIVSRFGVMFFDDPVQAFANLRRAVRDGGALRVIAWRSAAENPFMTTAERAAAPLLPDIPARPAGGPGQFAFADRAHVERVLEESGWGGIELRKLDVPCAFPEKELVRYATRLGPLGRVLDGADQGTRDRVGEAVRAAFEPYVDGAEVRYDAACWLVAARIPLGGGS